MRFLYFSTAVLTFFLANEAQGARLYSQALATDEPISTAQSYAGFIGALKKDANKKEEAMKKKAADLRDDLEAELKMKIKQEPAKLAKAMQGRLNSYTDLNGTGAEMTALETKIGEMVLIAKSLEGQPLSKNGVFVKAAREVEDMILNILKKERPVGSDAKKEEKKEK